MAVLTRSDSSLADEAVVLCFLRLLRKRKQEERKRVKVQQMKAFHNSVSRGVQMVFGGVCGSSITLELGLHLFLRIINIKKCLFLLDS